MLGDRLKELREDNDYKQDYIAEILKISRSSYANYENNRTEPPIEVLKKLSKFYNVSIDYLLEITDIKFRYYADKRKSHYINECLKIYESFLK